MGVRFRSNFSAFFIVFGFSESYLRFVEKWMPGEQLSGEQLSVAGEQISLGSKYRGSICPKSSCLWRAIVRGASVGGVSALVAPVMDSFCSFIFKLFIDRLSFVQDVLLLFLELSILLQLTRESIKNELLNKIFYGKKTEKALVKYRHIKNVKNI
jgi:hypothetical protein